jgi:hypothetical protein
LHQCNACYGIGVHLQSEANQLLEECHLLYEKYLGIDTRKLQFKFVFESVYDLHKDFGTPITITNNYDHSPIGGFARDTFVDEVHIGQHAERHYTLSAIIHEVMHIVQFQMTDKYAIRNGEPELIEGMTVWTEIYLMNKGGYSDYANRYKESKLSDSSVYGSGYRYIIKKYGDQNPIKKILEKHRPPRVKAA